MPKGYEIEGSKHQQLARTAGNMSEGQAYNRICAIETRTIVPVCLGATALIGVFISFISWYSHYRPFGDDPAVLVASAASPEDWFVHGFSRYFQVYPEWSVPSTNFLRPTVNGILWLDQILFGNHYIFYFLLFYAGQVLLIWMVVRMALELGVRGKWLILLALLLAFEPAFYNFGLFSASFQFDAWCGLFTVAAFFLLSRELYWLAVLSLLAAVFTKESALYAPVAAALTVAYGTRRRVLAGTMLLPLAAWYGARRLAFGNFSVKGIDAIPNSARRILVSVTTGILRWPSGFFKDADTHVTSVQDLLRYPSLPIFILINLFLWILLFVVGLRLFRKDSPGLLTPFTVVIWLSGALCFAALVAHDSRFGGSLYPLELLLLAVTSAVLPISRLRRASLIAICLMAPIFLWNMWRTGLAFEAARSSRDVMLRLMDGIEQNGRNAKVIYVLDSAPSFSAPEYLARFAGISGRIVVLSQFDGCVNGNGGSTSFSQRGASEIAIAVQLPTCAKLEFDGVRADILKRAGSGSILRGDFARYALPDEMVAVNVADPSLSFVDPGRKLELTLDGFAAHSSMLLYYDWTTGRYNCVGEQCSTRTLARY